MADARVTNTIQGSHLRDIRNPIRGFDLHKPTLDRVTRGHLVRCSKDGRWWPRDIRHYANDDGPRGGASSMPFFDLRFEVNRPLCRPFPCLGYGILRKEAGGGGTRPNRSLPSSDAGRYTRTLSRDVSNLRSSNRDDEGGKNIRFFVFWPAYSTHKPFDHVFEYVPQEATPSFPTCEE